MAPAKPSPMQLSACLRTVGITSGRAAPLNGTSRRFLSSTTVAREDVQTQSSTPAPPPPAAAAPSATEGKETPEYMKKWGKLDPTRVDWKRDERRLVRREGIQPVGSRRRRAILRRSAKDEIPFEQLPYQCFQEARKILLQDREEKLKEIATQKLRIENLMAQDDKVSGGAKAKETRLRSMRNHLNQLIILADINDPMVKKRFEDGEGDMNKPIYRYLAEQKWRKYKRLVLEQRITQFNLVPDFLPALDLAVDVDLAFGRKNVAPGEYVDSAISEKLPRLNVQTFEPGKKLVTVVVVDADVPVPESDSFTYRCHFIASNIPIAPDHTSIPLNTFEQQDRTTKDASTKKIGLPWLPAWAHRGAPYHRLGIFILEQKDAKALDVSRFADIKRDGFILRSFVDKNKLKPIGATLFRTQWDENTAGVMKRLGFESEVDIEFKRKKSEALPYKRRTERMR